MESFAMKEAIASVNIDKQGSLQTISDLPDPPKKNPKKNTSNAKPPKKPDKKVGRFERDYWVWPDGKRTPAMFIRQGITRRNEVPAGFYKSAAESKNPNIRRMATAAKEFGLKEMKE